MSNLSARVRFARRMAAGDASLRLYAILDAESCLRRRLELLDVIKAWRDAGVCLLQYRDKAGSDDDVLRHAERIAEVFRTDNTFLLLNDRAHLVSRVGWDGVHVGQGDGPVESARAQLGDDAIIGLSTHSSQQAEHADREDVDYVACGPVFATATKADASPVVGLCGLQAVRAVTRKPLVAIGGITASRGRQALAAGADAVAVINGMLTGEPGECASAFLHVLGA